MHRAAFAFLVLAVAQAAEARLTQSCNTNFGIGEVYVQANGRHGLLDIATRVSNNADAYYRLYEPRSARLGEGPTFNDYVVLEYDRAQDTAEIEASIRSDPVLAAMGVLGAFANTTQICFSALPPTTPVTVTEYFHSGLRHYFLSSSPEENAILDGGGAGGGWARTGETFGTIRAEYCYGVRPVFRFYNFQANTHFFTVDAQECGLVRREDPGWFYEGEAFAAVMPKGGTCAVGTTPVYRLYNNRWMFRDSNHRFTVRTEIRDRMAAQGWISEGVSMCLTP